MVQLVLVTTLFVLFILPVILQWQKNNQSLHHSVSSMKINGLLFHTLYEVSTYMHDVLDANSSSHQEVILAKEKTILSLAEQLKVQQALIQNSRYSDTINSLVTDTDRLVEYRRLNDKASMKIVAKHYFMNNRYLMQSLAYVYLFNDSLTHEERLTLQLLFFHLPNMVLLQRCLVEDSEFFHQTLKKEYDAFEYIAMQFSHEHSAMTLLRQAIGKTVASALHSHSSVHDTVLQQQSKELFEHLFLEVLRSNHLQKSKTLQAIEWLLLLMVFIYLCFVAMLLYTYKGFKSFKTDIIASIKALIAGTYKPDIQALSADSVTLLNAMKILFEREHNQANELLQYKKAIDKSASVMKIDEQLHILEINSELLQRLNKSFESLHMKPLCEVCIANDEQKIHVIQQIKERNLFSVALTFEQGESFEKLYFLCNVIPLFSAQQQIHESLLIMFDITMQKLQEEELLYRLYHNELTKLPNRVALFREIKQNSQLKLMVLDIDGFSKINAVYGDEMGDRILQDFSNALTHLIEGSALQLFKLSADVYVILADHRISDTFFIEDVVMLSHQLNPIYLDCFSNQIALRVNIGAALPAEHSTNRSLLGMANIALIEAKKSSRSYLFYSEVEKRFNQMQKGLIVLDRLHYIIEHELLQLYFQPIYDVRQQRVVKHEVLMRIADSNGEILSPATFLPIAKNAHIYYLLSQMMINKVFEAMKNDATLHLSINLSMEDILHAKTSTIIIENLQRYGCGHRLSIELLESEEVHYSELLNGFIEQVKRLGVTILIDDFGSGYSNYSHLIYLGVDGIKIDGSLISGIKKDETIYQVVRSIINISKELQLKTVAEYVSSEKIYTLLCELGVDMVQGYYIAKPSDSVMNDIVLDNSSEDEQ